MFLSEDDQSSEARLAFRKEWSVPIVNRIMEMRDVLDISLWVDEIGNRQAAIFQLRT